jgi:hypothetical protein
MTQAGVWLNWRTFELDCESGCQDNCPAEGANTESTGQRPRRSTPETGELLNV